MKSGSVHREVAGSSLYFGYGSNLWLAQMARRCPASKYIGVARLPAYKWIIMERGYANVVPSSRSASDEVYGLVYELQPHDLQRLDKNEGVPYSYIRKPLEVDFWPSTGQQWIDVTKTPRKETVMVYVDVNNTEPDEPRAGYIHRMNNGIRDALAMGVPQSYVENCIRPFVPDVEDEEGEELDNRKAEAFAIVHQHFRDALPKLDDRIVQNIADRLTEQEERNLDIRKEEASEIVNQYFRDTLPKIDPQVLENIASRVAEQESRDLDVRKSEAFEIVHQHLKDQLHKPDENVVQNIAWRVAEQQARQRALTVEDER